MISILLIVIFMNITRGKNISYILIKVPPTNLTLFVLMYNCNI